MEKQQLTEEEELAILFPEPVNFKLGAIVIPVSPMNTVACARFAAKARPIIKGALASGANFAGGPEGLTNVLGAIVVAAMDFPTELLEALAIATGRPVEFLGKLPPAAATALARLVFQVNADFFSQGPGLAAASGAPAITVAGSVGAGPTP